LEEILYFLSKIGHISDYLDERNLEHSKRIDIQNESEMDEIMNANIKYKSKYLQSKLDVIEKSPETNDDLVVFNTQKRKFPAIPIALFSN
jgi:hypothetical protein